MGSKEKKKKELGVKQDDSDRSGKRRAIKQGLDETEMLRHSFNQK